MLRNFRSPIAGFFMAAIPLSLATQVALSAPGGSDPGVRANFRQGMQDVVISYKMSPVTESGELNDAAIEAACVAVSLAKTMQADGADVTLFTTLDGVAIVNKEVLEGTGLGEENCLTPGSDGPPPNYPFDDETTLRDHIIGFLSNGGSIVACGLCWLTRFGDIDFPPPDFAEDKLIGYNEATGENDYDVVVGFTPDIQKLLREANKILDF